MEAERNRPYDIRKYFNYFFETNGFTSDTRAGTVSEQALQGAWHARGHGRGPALFIQGIMPRSGTVYAGELLRRHPDLMSYPYQLWEFPALLLTPHAHVMQAAFLDGYRVNRGKLAEDDFLAIVGGGLMAYLHAPVPEDKRVLVKMPSVQYLTHFYSMFPHEHLLVLIRDGRDVVHSTLRTWRHLNFPQVCLRWNRSARAVLTLSDQLESAPRTGYWLARYEDALEKPEAFVRETCARYGLDAARYPFEEIARIRVIGSSKLEKGDVTWEHLKPPEDFKPTQYWRRWPSWKKLVFKAIAGRSLKALGYADEAEW